MTLYRRFKYFGSPAFFLYGSLLLFDAKRFSSLARLLESGYFFIADRHLSILSLSGG